MKKSQYHQRLYLILIMVFVALGIGSISIWILYNASYNLQKEHLRHMVHSQAHLIEAVWKFDLEQSRDFPGGAREATLSQFIKSNKQLVGFGKTGEFTMAERKGDEIVFLSRKKNNKVSSSFSSTNSIKFDSDYAEPTKKALKGEAGIMEGLDYRGVKVLAAFEPVKSLEVGLVAKIDLSEIREPFIQAGYKASLGGLIIVILGTFAYLHYSEPLLRNLKRHNKSLQTEINLRMEAQSKIVESETRFRTLVENMPGIVYRCNNDDDWTMKFISSPIEKISGYPVDDFIGNRVRSFASIIHPQDREKVQSGIANALNFETSYSIEYRIVSKEGAIKWVLEQGQGVFDDNNCLFLDGTIFDITLLKEANNKIKEQKERLEISIQAARDGVWDWPDIKKEKMWWSPQWYSLIGYNNGELNPSISSFFNLIHPEDVMIAQHAFNQVHENENTFDLELRFRVKEGLYKWMRCQGKTTLDENFNTVRIVGSNRDVNDRKLAEEKVRKLSLAVEQSPASIIVTSKEGVIEYVNKSFVEITGYQKDEVIGENPRILKSGETSSQDCKKLWETITSGLEWRGVFHNKKKNGELYWENALISPIKNENEVITNFISVQEDVTAQRRLEKNLLDKQLLINSVIENILDGLIAIDEDGKIIIFNSAAETIFEYETSDLIGKEMTDLIPGKYRKRHAKGILKYLKTGTSNFIGKTHELEGLRKSGKTFPMELSVSVMANSEKKWFVGIIRDLSDKKEAEAQLKMAESQIISSEKLAGIGQLVAGVSHEVLNPVNIISVHTQLLQRKRREDPALQTFCTKVRHEIDRIQKIMGTLLVFSRKSEVEFEKVQPSNIINEILVLIEQDFLLDNIEIIKDLSSSESIFVMGDKDQLRQVFLNIVNNAKHVMKDGGTLTLKSKRENLGDKEFIRFIFSDTGTGIREEILTRIFEPFFSTKPEGEGTGLGLSVAHRIIEDHGGLIMAKNNEESGVSMIIDLPVA